MDLKVIVSTNKNTNDGLYTSDKMNQLMARAYQLLESENLLRPEVQGEGYEDKAFHNLDEFYGHMEELMTLDPTFMMLPLDEVPFAIDANTRTISNAKLAVMQNDQNAEIVTFTIDRYFDYKDLDTANIYIQWTLPDGTEGASAVEMKDLSIPEKIRFGWALDDKITSQEGTVKFSARFWNIDKIADENGNLQDMVVYSFNTKTASLTITKSLQPQLNEGVSVNSPLRDGFFKKAIINSRIHNENIALPADVYFTEPGLNLHNFASLSWDPEAEKETLTLIAQAIAHDAGELEYKWEYKPAVDCEINGTQYLSNTWYPFDTEIIDDEIIPGFSAFGGSVNYADYQEVKLVDNKLVPGEKYYMEKDGAMVAYDGSRPIPTLYEKFTTYTVPDNKTDADGNEVIVPVTGEYRVKATNKMGSNVSSVAETTTCQLVSPDEVVFTKNAAGAVTGDLDSTEIFPVDASGNDLDIDLSVAVVNDDSIAAQRTYTWTRCSADPAVVEETVVKSAAEEGHKFTATVPGWYQVVVKSMLNRETKELHSTVCKVASKTVAPQLVSEDPDIAAAQILTMSYGPEALSKNKDEKNIPQYYGSLGNEFVLDVTTALNAPEGYNAALYSENLSYSWGYQVQDGSFKMLTANDVGDGKLVVDGLGTNRLTVRILEDDKKYTYKCIITNIVNGESAACTQGEALAFAVQ